MSTPPDPANQSKNSAKNNPLPEVEMSEILGFVELLRSLGGNQDVYKVAQDLKMELGDTLDVVRAAELLGLVRTPGGDVVLEKLGDQIARSKINEKKEIIHQQLRKIPIIRQVCEILNETENREMMRPEMLEKLADLIPNEDAENSFNAIVEWGRYAELYGYNDDTESFYLDPEGLTQGRN